MWTNYKLQECSLLLPKILAFVKLALFQVVSLDLNLKLKPF